MKQLTEIELKIMDMVTSGLSNAEISKALKISNDKTNSYVSSIYRKLDKKRNDAKKQPAKIT